MKEKTTLVKNYISFFIALIMAFMGFGLPNPEVKQNPQEGCTRIMTFNIRYDEFFERRNYVPTLIREYLPDSIGIQECTYNWYVDLIAMLPEYGFVGVGREGGDRSIDCGEMSAVLYRKDKYTLVDSGTFWLSDTPNKISKGWDAYCNRICTWAVLEDNSTGKRYAHVNTHFDHKGVVAVEEGAKLVKEKALTFNIPTVVTGDFNLSEGSTVYNQFFDSDIKDSKYLAPDSDSGFTFHGYHPETRTTKKPIDYIGVNNLVKSVKTYKIIRDKYENNFVSDHYPIMSDMQLY